MKSLEEVIKYKLNFLLEEIEPFYAIQTYTAERGPHTPPRFYEIYKTKNTVFSNDSFSFMEDITPLFIYISSCDKYHRENGQGKIDDISIKLIMEGDYEELDFGSTSSRNLETHDGFELHRISRLKWYRNNFFSRVGYCARYTKPFTILFKGGFDHILTEEERLQLETEIREMEEAYYRGEAYQREMEDSRNDWGTDYYSDLDNNYSDSDDNNPKEELSINDFRTFKEDCCVICLEEEPKVLFCNCGHLCICGKCLVHKFDNCPVCKKENTILRIIE